MTKTNRPSFILLGLLALVAAAGLTDAFLVHLIEFRSQSDPTVLGSCNLNSILNCSPVLTSSYSKLFGIPVSLIGMVFDEGMLLLALGLLFGFPLRHWQIYAISAVVIVSLLFSNYLIYMSYAALGVFCPYCLVSNISTDLVAIFWFSYLIQRPRPTLQSESKM